MRLLTTGTIVRKIPCFVEPCAAGPASSFLSSMLLFTAANGTPAAEEPQGAHNNMTIPLLQARDRAMNVSLELT